MGKRLRLGRRAVPEILVAEVVRKDEQHVRLWSGGPEAEHRSTGQKTRGVKSRTAFARAQLPRGLGAEAAEVPSCASILVCWLCVDEHRVNSERGRGVKCARFAQLIRPTQLSAR